MPLIWPRILLISDSETTQKRHFPFIHDNKNKNGCSPNGPVTFSNGNIKISANEVEINGETNIQVGTSFEIKTGD